MVNTAKIQDSHMSNLLEHSLLITGSKESGKTRTIQMMVKELIQQSKKVCLLDFLDTYRAISEEIGETFVDQLSLQDILISNRKLFRITFNKDILFFKEKCNLDFLNEISSEIDYLIVDEAQHLFFRAEDFEIECLLNKGIKVVLALETMECFEITDVLKIKRLMNELMFRDNQNGLAYLQDGEALLVRENRIINRFNLNVKECID